MVALHRAAHLTRANPDARALLTTFSEALASSLRIKLARLIGTEPRVRERIDVEPLHSVARRLHERMLGRVEVASRNAVRQLVHEATRDETDRRAGGEGREGDRSRRYGDLRPLGGGLPRARVAVEAGGSSCPCSTMK